jgi:hypothetical protein
MNNAHLEIAGTGGWVELSAAVGFPRNTTAVSMQLRVTGQDMQYRFIRQDGTVPYWTIKSGTARAIQGMFDPGEIFVQAPTGQTIEVEVSTQLTI